jgi:hypothetical protein
VHSQVGLLRRRAAAKKAGQGSSSAEIPPFITAHIATGLLSFVRKDGGEASASLFRDLILLTPVKWLSEGGSGDLEKIVLWTVASVWGEATPEIMGRVLVWLSALCAECKGVASAIVQHAGEPGSLMRSLMFLYRGVPSRAGTCGWEGIAQALNSAVAVLTARGMVDGKFEGGVCAELRKLMPVLASHLPHPCKRGETSGGGGGAVEDAALGIMLRWCWGGGDVEELRAAAKVLGDEGGLIIKAMGK